MFEDNIIPLSTETKRVVITGCTRGLGKALAEGFVQRGDVVAGCGRSLQVLSEMQAEWGEPHWFSHADVSDDTSVEVFCEEAIHRMGVPNLVLNNAGVINPNAPIWEIPPDEFSEIMEVNVGGTVSMLRHLLPDLIDAGNPAVVVNFSSSWGRTTSPEVAPYCASKWAIEGLSRAVAQEVPPYIGIVALNPGAIHTKMLETCFGPSGAAQYPEPDDWARAAVPFLANLGPSDNGKALTAP